MSANNIFSSWYPVLRILLSAQDGALLIKTKLEIASTIKLMELTGLTLDLPTVTPTTGVLTAANRWDHIQARWAIRRGQHRVQPGLYALGSPGLQSPVFVTANYSLSFDALRTAVNGMDAYILVLDTQGINVWCAAGKGTFGTDELCCRIELTRLSEVVNHRTLILPQLGAPGVAAHVVRQRTGFKVEYGPIRAADLLEYLKTHTATPAMRTVRFNLWDRMVLIPVELVHILLPLLAVMVVVYLAAGLLPALAVGMAILSGVALFPILLPWLPAADFSVKGFLLGFVVVLPFSLLILQQGLASGFPGWLAALNALAYLLALPPVTAFISLNFTGSTPFTSRTGVRREIFSYIRVMAVLFGAGMLVFIVLVVYRLAGRI